MIFPVATRRDMAGKLPVEEVKNVLAKEFGIISTDVEELYGFLCLNFKISTQKDELNPARDANFIMKLTDRTHHCSCADGKEYAVQLLTFLDGVTLVEANLTKAEMESIGSDFGTFVGRMHKSIMTLEYDTDGLKIFNEYHAENALHMREKLAYVEDKGLKQLADKYFDLFEKNFIPRKNELRRIFAHADISDGNTIIRKNATGWEIAGLIDFEDCHVGYLVGDFGVAVGYAMLKAATVGNCDVIEVSKRVVQSYERVRPLTAPEREVLFEIAMSRVVVSYVTACYKTHLEPENREFLFRQPRCAPAVMRTVHEIGRSRILATWFGE